MAARILHEDPLVAVRSGVSDDQIEIAVPVDVAKRRIGRRVRDSSCIENVFFTRCRESPPGSDLSPDARESTRARTE